MELLFLDPELERLAFDRDYQTNISTDLVRSYRRKIQTIISASSRSDLRAIRGLRLKKLKGNLKDQYSIRVNDQWRLIVIFASSEHGEVVSVISFEDYHK
jgi:proteic killer suppression protein